MTYTEFYNKFEHLLTNSVGTLWDPHEFDASEKINFDFIHHNHPIYTIKGVDTILTQPPEPIFDELEEIFNAVHSGRRMNNDIKLKEIEVYMSIRHQKTLGWVNRVPTTILHHFIHIRQFYNLLFLY
jgi:hypothetical protein